MHSPKDMLKQIGKNSEFGKLPLIPRAMLRDCQYEALTELEEGLRSGAKRFLAILATGSGKTYLACLAAYRQACHYGQPAICHFCNRTGCTFIKAYFQVIPF